LRTKYKKSLPILIEVFGIDGSGKTTLSHNLKNELNDRGLVTQLISPLQLSDPFLHSIRSLVQKVPKSKKLFHQRSESFLAAYFSFAFVDLFLKSCEENLDVILCDRYLNSHCLNQATFGVDLQDFSALFSILPEPKIALMIDVPLEVALSRLYLRGNIKRHEQESFLKKSREMHLEHSIKKNISVLDGTLSRKELTFYTIDFLVKQGIPIPKKRGH